MRIYIDFDDVITETAVAFTEVARELFDIDVPYQEFQFFNMQKTFGLTNEQYDELMRVGHLPEKLLSYQEAPGACDTINRWIDEGHEVSVITGRPFEAYEPSRQWLDNHGLERAALYCVDKYGREKVVTSNTFNLTLDDLYNMTFDLAVEDSPLAFEHVTHFEGCKVAVYNRPWNTQVELPGDNFVRCAGWNEIAELAEKIQA